MHILQLQAENVKGLTAVQINSDGTPVVLTGENGAGKSSVLDAIFLALTNQGLADPIRHGAQKATVKLNLGEITVERRVTGKGTYLEVLSKGMKVSSPQALLDSLVGDLTLDPLDFTRLKPADRREMLLKSAGVSTADLDAQYQQLYDERTVANRLATQAESKAAALLDAPAGTPDKEQAAADLRAQYTALTEKHLAFDRSQATLGDLKDKRVRLVNQIATDESDIAELKRKLAVAEQKLSTDQSKLAEHDKEQQDFIATMPAAPANLAELEVRIREIDQVNRNVRTKQAKKAAEAEATKARVDANTLDSRIREVQAKKLARLASAKFGVDGLSVTEDGVAVNGVMFEQLSTAKQIEISTLLAMKQNPKLKIILIREGALIGKAIFASICALATQHGYQLWVERMQENAGPVGLHIAHGRIVARDGKPEGEESPTPGDADAIEL